MYNIILVCMMSHPGYGCEAQAGSEYPLCDLTADFLPERFTNSAVFNPKYLY